MPAIAIVSEEDAHSLQYRLPNGTFWLVDPLDGTKEFLARNAEFYGQHCLDPGWQGGLGRGGGARTGAGLFGVAVDWVPFVRKTAKYRRFGWPCPRQAGSPCTGGRQ